MLNVMTFLESLVLFYFLMIITKGIDYRISNEVEQIKHDYTYHSDYDNMPLAPHRYKMPDYENSVWLFHRTKTSMQDFVHFVQYESTQAIMDHDFYLNNNVLRSEKAGNLIPSEDMILFKPGQVYNRTIVRQFLYEYYAKRATWSRHSINKRDDGSRFYFFAKSVKDYIIATGK